MSSKLHKTHLYLIVDAVLCHLFLLECIIEVNKLKFGPETDVELEENLK